MPHPKSEMITEQELIEIELSSLTGKNKWEYHWWVDRWQRRYRMLTQTSRTFKKLRKTKSWTPAVAAYPIDATELVESLRHEAFYLLKLRALARERWKTLVENRNT
jgi:hypothetical protein